MRILPFFNILLATEPYARACTARPGGRGTRQPRRACGLVSTQPRTDAATSGQRRRSRAERRRSSRAPPARRPQRDSGRRSPRAHAPAARAVHGLHDPGAARRGGDLGRDRRSRTTRSPSWSSSCSTRSSGSSRNTAPSAPWPRSRRWRRRTAHGAARRADCQSRGARAGSRRRRAAGGRQRRPGRSAPDRGRRSSRSRRPRSPASRTPWKSRCARCRNPTCRWATAATWPTRAPWSPTAAAAAWWWPPAWRPSWAASPACCATEDEVKTPLQKRLAQFGRGWRSRCWRICALVFVVGVLRGEPLMLMLLTAVSLAVAAIPEALAGGGDGGAGARRAPDGGARTP